MTATLRWADGGPVYSDSTLRWDDGGPAWLEVLAIGGAVIEGAFSGEISIVQALSGQLGCGGGMSATAGSAECYGGGVEGKQGHIDANLAAIVQALFGNAGNSAVFSSQIADVLQAMSGKQGVTGQLASELDDIGAHLIEIVIGGKIHRIVISARTGAAVILTKTGHINITTN